MMDKAERDQAVIDGNRFVLDTSKEVLDYIEAKVTKYEELPRVRWLYAARIAAYTFHRFFKLSIGGAEDHIVKAERESKRPSPKPPGETL